ncbi:MAG: sigma-70 family RNA polymerase sigma factor [Actinomycetota bacterium]
MPRTTFHDSSGEDLVRMYLTEIGRHPLLAAEQEVVLAKAMEAGSKADADLDRAKASLAPATRLGLERRSAEGAVARSAFIQANLRLVVSIARRYQGFGLPLLDLIQDGNVGLLRAVEKFDWRMGFKFSTYATWWIRQGISRGLAERSRTIRLPVHVAEAVQSVRRADADLTASLGREPTEAEVAAALHITVDQLRIYRDTALETMSLQTPIGEEGAWELQDILEDEACDQPLEMAVQSRSNDELREVIKTLKPREQRILELRFGLADGKQRTLEQVGVEFKLTRERIRQIEAKAIAKLRHPLNGRALQDFVD